MNIPLVLYKLFRVKPVVAWAVSGFLLAVSVAIYEHKFALNWEYLALSFMVIVIIQAFLAHALNDIFDEDVDRITDMKGTNRFKVLISGLATRKELISISILAISAVILLILYLYKELGFYILIFGAVGLYAPIAYSVKPLKLGWKPFSEWTVVFPTLVTLVVAVDYVATGALSLLAFYTGVVFALFSVIWFLMSRYMDFEPDRVAGKITSPVYFDDVSLFRTYYIFIFLITTTIVGMLMFTYNIAFTVSLFWICYILMNIDSDNIEDRVIASTVRTELIYVSILNSLSLALVFVFL